MLKKRLSTPLLGRQCSKCPVPLLHKKAQGGFFKLPYCHACEINVEGEALFCPNCGNALEKTKDRPVPQPEYKAAGKPADEFYYHATKIERFTNLATDLAAVFTINATILSLLIFFVYPEELLYYENYQVVSLFFVPTLGAFLYYFLLERAFEQTLGKYITGTRVITKDGEKPCTKTLALRTLVRFVPFEVFSGFTISTYKGCWHDDITGTDVIKVGTQPIPKAGATAPNTALASFILGLISLVVFYIPFINWVLQILAIVLGYTAFGQAKELNLPGRDTARAGIVLGFISVFYFIVFTIIGFALM